MSSRVKAEEAAEYIPCSKSWLEKLREKGGGPRFIRKGRCVLYDTADLDQWLEDCKRKSNADTGAAARRPRRARRRR